MPARGTVRRASAAGVPTRDAVARLARDLGGPEAAMVVLFVSPDVDRVEFESAIAAEFGGTPVVGCTTAGEIGPAGPVDSSITGFSLPADAFTVAAGAIAQLQAFEVAAGETLVNDLTAALQARGVRISPERVFAMLLVDGLSVREEIVASALNSALRDIPLFGGSAGDGLRFRSTAVFHEGRWVQDAAVLLLVHTTLPFRVFKSQHLAAGTHKIVVTEADAHERVVRELDGEPAAQAYARAVGVGVEELGPAVFAAHPVIVRIGGHEFVRSIQQRNADDSLTFYCAIEEGLVLSLARSVDLADSIDEALGDVDRELRGAQVVLGCDCILRRLESQRDELRPRIAEIYSRRNVVGFATYGEQFRGMHVNQTFTGVAIGHPEHEAA